MKKINKSKLIITIFILLILIISGILIFNKGNITHKDGKDEIGINFTDDKKIEYSNSELSYYDEYYEKGVLVLNVEEFVKLPDNYSQYKISGNNSEELQQRLKETIYIIRQDSEIYVPNKLVSGLYGEFYNNIKIAAENEGKTIDEYIKAVYELNSYEELAKTYEEQYNAQVKEDLFYQALLEEFNITVNDDDVLEYFSERVQKEGYDLEKLKFMYGEELVYKYTIENKVQQELLKIFTQE